jgi:F-type H+-transporting ATPase subunit b
MRVRFNSGVRAASLALALAGGLVAAGVALASGGGGGEAEGGSWFDFLWRMINFLVLVGVFAWLGAKRVKAFFGGRREGIKQSLAEAEAARADAEKRYQETTAKLDKATAEIAQIQGMIEAQGQAEKARLVEDARKAAEKIKEDTQARMEQEFAKASLQLRGEAVRLSVEMAEELLKRNIGPADHETMVKEYIEKVVTRH